MWIGIEIQIEGHRQEQRYKQRDREIEIVIEKKIQGQRDRYMERKEEK